MSEEDAEKLLLNDKLLSAVFVEAQVVCVLQPLPVVGDLNADPCIIPCLAKGIAAGRFVDLALAHSIGAGKEPEGSYTFKLDDCAGSRRGFIVARPNALAASSSCQVTDRWFAPHFSIFADFQIRQWTAEVSCPGATQPVWLACWVDTPDQSSPPLGRSRMFGTSTGRSWRLSHLTLFSRFGMFSAGVVRMIFEISGVVVFCGRVAGLVAQLPLASRPLSA